MADRGLERPNWANSGSSLVTAGGLESVPFADIAADCASRQRQQLRSPGSFLAHPSASPAFRSPSIIVGFTPRATVRPSVYSTEVNIQSLNLVTASVGKVVLPLINSGAVVAREPKVADAATLGRQIDAVKPPPLGATMDDCSNSQSCCWAHHQIGDTAHTIAILMIVSLV